MQSTLELDMRSPIVCRVLRMRERMKRQAEPVPYSSFSESTAACMSIPQQGYEDSSDPVYRCAGRADYSVQAWEKLSIRPQETFWPARPALDRAAVLPDPAESER